MASPLGLGYSGSEGERNLGSVKIGIFGGTFNPIHLGHLHIARRVQALFDLDKVHFVVATTPPHKRLEELVPFIHRYAMVSLAVAAHSSFAPSLAELDPPSSPFSLHTMEKFSLRYRETGADLYFIAGGDSLMEVGGWHSSGDLLSRYNFIFAARPGVQDSETAGVLPPGVERRVRDLRGQSSRRIRAKIKDEERGEGNLLFILDVGAPDISGSQIRELVSMGRPYSHLVPRSVSQYVQKLHLYGER